MANIRFLSLPVVGFLVGMLISGVAIGAIGHKFLISWVSSEISTNSDETSFVSESVYLDDTRTLNSGESSVFSESWGNDKFDSDLTRIAKIKGEFARTTALHQLVATADEYRLTDLLAQSTKVRPDILQVRLQKPIIQRLTMIDPIRALEAIESLPFHRQESLMRTVFAEWSEVSLDQSVAYAKNLNEAEKYAALQGILHSRFDLSDEIRREIAREVGNENVADEVFESESFFAQIENPQQAWYELIEEGDHSIDNLGNLIRVADAWVRRNGLGVLNQISGSIDDTSRRISVVTSVVLNSARRDPSGTVSQLLSMDEKIAKTAAPRAIHVWAKSDPKSALAAASSVESGSLRRSLEQSVISVWANSDPHELLASIDSLSENVIDLAEAKAVRSIARSAPAEAARLLVALDMNPKNSGIANAIASSWSKSDPLAAVDWVLNTPRLEPVQRQLLEPVLGNLAKSDSDQAMELALQQPEEMGLEATVVSRLASVDPLKALDWLSLIRDDNHAFSAFTSVGAELLKVGKKQRAMTLAEEVPREYRHAYYQSLFNEWARNDPEDLLSSLERLPSKSAKSTAAFELAMQSRFKSGFLSEEQIEYAKTFLRDIDATIFENTDAFVGFEGESSVRIIGDSASDLFLDSEQIEDLLDELTDEMNQSVSNSSGDTIRMAPIVRREAIIFRKDDGEE
ncbi:MAG: hypothetical protein F4X44_08105 [Gammaproteobacteria bacterium]|nr:hypothetical protein [Gammaproteobacteria bacterium]MYD80560.1 hypothetical protein [Gammaproteobacteria bacterium]